MDKLKIYLIETIKIFIIAIAITCFWQLLEIVMIGEIRPNKVDTVIALILTFSIYGNLNRNKIMK